MSASANGLPSAPVAGAKRDPSCGASAAVATRGLAGLLACLPVLIRPVGQGAERGCAAIAERAARHLSELLLAEQHAEQATGRKAAERPAGDAEAACGRLLPAETAHRAADQLADTAPALASRSSLTAARGNVGRLLLTAQVGEGVWTQKLFEQLLRIHRRPHDCEAEMGAPKTLGKGA